MGHRDREQNMITDRDLGQSFGKQGSALQTLVQGDINSEFCVKGFHGQIIGEMF